MTTEQNKKAVEEREFIIGLSAKPRISTFFAGSEAVVATPSNPAASTFARVLFDAYYNNRANPDAVPTVRASAEHGQRAATLWLAKGAMSATLVDEFNVVDVARATHSDYSENSTHARLLSSLRPTYFEEPSVLTAEAAIGARRLYDTMKGLGVFAAVILPHDAIREDESKFIIPTTQYLGLAEAERTQSQSL
ncbi:MAG: hypothetical protein JWO35_428 [Candidatus Saccharibacteria bacterium]|nr:hypothetical protein [Candidatus Saccharibacteria bacterium]